MGNCFPLFVGIAPTVERDLYTVKATGSMPVLNMVQLKEQRSYGEVASFLLWEQESRVRFPIRLRYSGYSQRQTYKTFYV